MQLSPEEQSNLSAIATNSASMQDAVLKAYEEGILMGALRAAQKLGAMQLASQTSSNTGGDGDDDEADSPLTDYDRRMLSGLGIDPDKKIKIKNSTFHVTGYKPSRPKYPISMQNQNGRRFKFTIEQVKTHQRINGVR